MVRPSAFLLCLKTSFLRRSEMVRHSAFLLCLKTSFLRRSEMVRPSAFLRCCIINPLSPNSDENNIYIIDTAISSRKKDYVKMIRKMH